MILLRHAKKQVLLVLALGITLLGVLLFNQLLAYRMVDYLSETEDLEIKHMNKTPVLKLQIL